MKKVVETGKLPIKMWLDDIEDGAMKQAINLAQLPFAFKHVAIMPDSHEGYGMPIGGVLATKGVVIPNAVGVDIGCGMCAVKTKLTGIDTDTLKAIMGEIRVKIPMGMKRHKKAQDEALMPSRHSDPCKQKELNLPIVSQEYGAALCQLGTLGGGNHFIEIQKGSDGYVWLMIHSGSRNIGLKVASHYNKLAKELNKAWATQVPPIWDLAHLPLNSKEGEAYMAEMQYCVDFALANRKLMMERVKQIVREKTIMNDWAQIDAKDSGCFEPMINIAHNYAIMENHFGENVLIHRKGATLARKDTVGIIPGSQGSSSYIVKGKGNKESFMSCSHGAGRKMSRSKAKEMLSLKEEIEKLDKKGVVHGVRQIGDLDEAAGAYKDIDLVMANQEDLVEILVKLEPLAVLKG